MSISLSLHFTHFSEHLSKHRLHLAACNRQKSKTKIISIHGNPIITFWTSSSSSQKYWSHYRRTISLAFRLDLSLKPFGWCHYLYWHFLSDSLWNCYSVRIANALDHEFVVDLIQYRMLRLAADCSDWRRILFFSPFYVRQLEIVYLLLRSNCIPFAIRRKRKQKQVFIKWVNN